MVRLGLAGASDRSELGPVKLELSLMRSPSSSLPSGTSSPSSLMSGKLLPKLWDTDSLKVGSLSCSL